MKDLRRLIHAVTEEESESVIRYYSLNNNGSSKRLKLFNMVRWKDIKDDRIAARKLYNSSPCAAFSQLKKRLKEDILNILMARESTPCSSPKNFVDAEAMALKYVLQGKLLLNRGLTEEAVDVLKKAFKLARDHEAFEVEAIAHSVCKHSAIGDCSNKLAVAEQNFASHIDDFYQLMKLNLEQSIHASTSIDEATSVQPKAGCKKTASIRLRFLSVYQELETLLDKREFEQAQHIAAGILDEVYGNGHLLSASQKGRFFLSLSKVNLGLEKFSVAKCYSQQAAELFKPFEEKKLAAQLILYKSQFHAQELDEARSTLKACEAMQQELGKDKSEIPLFQAYQKFQERDFRGSVKTLNQFFRRAKPAIEVLLNGRMLELQNLIEIEDYDWFDYKLDSFRKIVKYHACEHLAERFTLIYKVFTELKRCAYQKEALLAQGKHELLQKLTDKEGQFYWNPLGSEMVPVHSWLTA